MKFYQRPFVLFLFFMFGFVYAQQDKNIKYGKLNPKDYEDFKTYLKSKNIALKDTILIKYDFNSKDCWSKLDESDPSYFRSVMKGKQKEIKNFNANHQNAISVSFREPGNQLNFVIKWDKTILIDDNLFLKNMFFTDNSRCGTSLVIFDDATYALYFGDSHFEMLRFVENQKNEQKIN